MEIDTVGLGTGERATDFVLPLEPGGKQTRFYAKAGGIPVLLVFMGDGSQEPAKYLLDALSNKGDFAVFGVRTGGEAIGKIPFPVFRDGQGAVASAYRLGQEKQNVVFVLDANLRVLGSAKLEDGEPAVNKVQALLEDAGKKNIEPIEVQVQAPVLLIPRVLDRKICNFLVQVWQHEGNEETGVERSQGAARKETIDHQDKRRRDHVVMDEQHMKMLSSTIGRRVMPEVQRAFGYRATRFEGFKIACYDAADSGFFDAHRDNLSPATAHRRFALTVNLNEGYEGGFLRFPEFGPHLYRPEPGGAVIFSCSHLHEVTPVVVGRRFALLSFLFGEEGIRGN
jgi:predicted 2-oxoglutarate/Fe(II)-dependent dioxygenase YbiX